MFSNQIVISEGQMAHSKVLSCPLYGPMSVWCIHFICSRNTTREVILCDTSFPDLKVKCQGNMGGSKFLLCQALQNFCQVHGSMPISPHHLSPHLWHKFKPEGDYVPHVISRLEVKQQGHTYFSVSIAWLLAYLTYLLHIQPIWKSIPFPGQKVMQVIHISNFGFWGLRGVTTMKSIDFIFLIYVLYFFVVDHIATKVRRIANSVTSMYILSHTVVKYSAKSVTVFISTTTISLLPYCADLGSRSVWLKSSQKLSC